jgi:hypothetical protein
LRITLQSGYPLCKLYCGLCNSCANAPLAASTGSFQSLKEIIQARPRRCARNEVAAIATVNTILDGVRDIGVEMIRIRVRKAKQIVQDYARRKPGAVRLVDKLITAAGKSMDALHGRCTRRETRRYRGDRSPTTIAESRRNASLREIDRHRAVLGETLRRSMQEIEDSKFEVIEATPAKRENAA